VISKNRRNSSDINQKNLINLPETQCTGAAMIVYKTL
jgi:hypothetical protein